MRRAVLILSLLLAGCGGAARQPPATPAPPADPPGLLRVRAGYATFAASAATAGDFDALAQASAAERPQLPSAARAEADLALVLAGLRLIETNLEDLTAADELMAATVLPLTWQTRPLDGESAPAFRDRLCQGPGAEVCAEALPDFWGAALVYAAAGQLAARARSLAATCGCGARYPTELKVAAEVAEAARVHDSDERPGWTLAKDHLARSAFATPDWPPGDVRVRVRLAELLPSKRKPLAAKLSELRTAAPKPAENAALLIEVEAFGDTRLAELALLASAARDAGFAGMLLTVRVAAPPNPRGFLEVELAAARPAKGATTLSLPAASKKDAMQLLVDQIDAAYGTSEAARVVWVVK